MARRHSQDQLPSLIKVLGDKQVAESDLSHALIQCASIVTQQSVDPDIFTSLCIALIDVILPRLGDNNNNGDDLLSKFYDIFMLGTPSISFFLLSSGLSSSSTSFCVETLAKTVINFVSDPIRISHIISKPHNTDIVNHLLHLPTKLSNILLSQGTSSSSTVQLLDENVYFQTLAIAIFIQPMTSDSQRDRIISELLARLVVMGKSNVLISTFLTRAFSDSKSDQDAKVKRVVSLLEKAPPSSLKELTRALIEDNQCKSERFTIVVLSRLLLCSRSARNATFYEIAFRHPLLTDVRRSTRRIVRALREGSGLVREGLIASAEMWSGEEFALGADVSLQRQVTRLLLYYLQAAAKVKDGQPPVNENEIMMVIVDGVHTRLNEEDIRIRRHAMVVGEAASRHAGNKNPLTFDRDDLSKARKEQNRMIGDDDRDDGGDSDFSDIGRNVGNESYEFSIEGRSDFCKDTEMSNDENGELGLPEIDAAGNINKVQGKSKEEEKADTRRVSNGESKGKRRRGLTVVYTWPDSKHEEWEDEDDWENPAEYESGSDDNSGFGTYYASDGTELKQEVAALREKLPAPMSVGRLLELLREMNGSDGGAVTVKVEEALAAIRVITAHASQDYERTGAIRSAASSICLELVRFEAERYPDDTVTELQAAREDALISIIQLDIAACGSELVQAVICGGTSDIGRRLYALSALSSAVAGRHESGGTQGGKTTEVEVDMASRARVRQTEGLTDVFRLLVDGVCAGAGAEFLEPDGRDCRVWAQALVTLAILANGAGKGTHGRWMRGELMDVSISRVARIDGDPVVRRAIALTLGSVIDGMADEELSSAFMEKAEIVLLEREREEADVAGNCVKWLRNASENDADVGVRRFAVIAIRKLASRMDTL